MDKKLWILIFIWLLLVVISLNLGAFKLNLSQIIYEEYAQNVFFNIRMPRILLASLSGGILGISGLTLQALFKNPLVGPKIIGVSTSSALGGALAILFGFSGIFLVLNAFVFGILALLLLFLLAKFIQNSNIFSLILCGILINGFAGALIALIEFLADDEEKLPNIIFWMLGSFSVASWEKLEILIIFSIIPLVLLFLMRYHLNLLSLSDNDLKGLGINFKFSRKLILILTTILIASQVSVCGNIAYVGLVVPHMSRFLGSANHQKILPYCFFLGMIFMLACDDFARIISSAELPLGILTALIGTPFFIYLLKRNFNAN
ncbi:iron ABC transporter permease [Campylobacter sp.]|uniref:FecCD family ABC transporter permease n=1 Tax=Campylobacter sp. TaxID=205 RepID=UPI0025BE9C0C|nr:iron ABC transporter permease [Campylobacter sp.]